MELAEIEKKIRDILKRNFTILGLTGISAEEIKNTDHFMDDLGIESVGIMGIISEIEKVFDIKIEEGELSNENLGNIERTAKYISKKLKDK
jgi:acyl carrier protein